MARQNQKNQGKSKYPKRTQNQRRTKKNSPPRIVINYNVSPCTLDNRLQSLCLNPDHFNMIIYLLHDLDQAKMYGMILEICKINPYLAVKAYVLSEFNESFVKELKNHLLIPNEADVSFISTALAWILLDDYREALNILSKRKIDFEHLENFWFEEFGILCINSGSTRLWKQYFNAFMDRYGNLDTPYQNEIRATLREMYQRALYHRDKYGNWDHEIIAFIEAVEASGQYGEMLKIVPDYEAFYWDVFDLVYPQRLYNLTLIYINNHCSQEKLINNRQKLKNKLRGQNYWDIHYMLFPYHTNVNKSRRKAKQIPFGVSWDAELNGSEDMPDILYYYSKYWWRGDCGHVWRESFEDVRRRSRCPICNENFKVLAKRPKTEQARDDKNG